MLLHHGYPAALYRQTSIETASPGQLVLMLYRRAILATRQAAQAMERKEMEKAHKDLLRAQAIVFELKMALNPEAGQLADGLAGLYDFFHRQLIDANVRKDPAPAQQVGAMMESLLEAWEVVLGPSSTTPKVILEQSRVPQNGRA